MYMETAKDMKTQIYYCASMLDILHMGKGTCGYRMTSVVRRNEILFLVLYPCHFI